MRARLVLAALACFAVGCNLADMVVLWPPSGATDANSGAVRRVVQSAGKGVEIWTAHASRDSTEAYILEFYGNADRAERHVGSTEARVGNGVEVWGVNYPGYGGSDGPATLHGVAEAAIAAYDDLATIAGGKPIFAFGTSLGTAAALHLAARRDVRGLLLVNPPPLRRLVLEEYGWWNLWLLAGPTALQIPDDLDSEENARKCHAPAIFVTAQRDEIVPLFLQGRVVRAYAGPKQVILVPDGTHNGEIPLKTEREIATAIQQMLRPPVPARY